MSLDNPSFQRKSKQYLTDLVFSTTVQHDFARVTGDQCSENKTKEAVTTDLHIVNFVFKLDNLVTHATHGGLQCAPGFSLITTIT